MGTDWLERLQQGRNSLSRAEADLVAFINDHPDKVVSLTQQRLAEVAGVSKPVVISCFRHLGFDDYRSFRTSIERFFSTQIDSLRASRSVQSRVGSMEELLFEATAVDTRTLTRLGDSLSPETMERVARSCFTAESLYFCGEGTGHYPAHYVSQRLRRYGRNTVLLGEDRSHAPDTLHPLGQRDALFLFHYSDRDDWLWPILDLARERDAWTLLVSGTIHPDYVAAVTEFVHVPRGELQFKNSIAVPMHFANLILLACELLYRQETEEQLAALEDTRHAWNEAAGKLANRQGGKNA